MGNSVNIRRDCQHYGDCRRLPMTLRRTRWAWATWSCSPTTRCSRSRDSPTRQIASSFWWAAFDIDGFYQNLLILQGGQKYSGTQIMLTSKWELCLVYKVSTTCLALRRKSHLQVNKICVPESFCHPVRGQWHNRLRWLRIPLNEKMRDVKRTITFRPIPYTSEVLHHAHTLYWSRFYEGLKC